MAPYKLHGKWIWDAFNGTGTGIGLNGTPAGWALNTYWSATQAPTSSNHAALVISQGLTTDFADANTAYAALQVL